MKRSLTLIVSVLALTSCSTNDAPDRSQSTSTVTTSHLTISETPQSEWPTKASDVETPTPGNQTTESAPSRTASSAHKQTVKTFVTDFLATDNVSQEAWFKKLQKNADTQLAGRLSSEGLERLPHGKKVTGDPQLLSISDTEAISYWFVPTDNGGYTVELGMARDTAKVADLRPGRTPLGTETLDQD